MVKGQTILSNESLEGGALVAHVFNQKKCEQKMIEYVIMDEMPFRVVEGKGFLALMHEAQPRFKVPNRMKVAAGVFDLFLAEKAKIKSMIHGQRVSITTDTWTSIQNINYMVVTCHFVDSDWKLHKRIISFTKIISHSGDDIGKMLEMCLHDWGIGKLFSITVDNASSNNAAIDFTRKKFKTQKTLIVDGRYLHLRCACHILNLIVKDGLNELKSSIKAIRNAVEWIHSSPSRLQKFRYFAILEDFEKMPTVPMDVKTRWNATYKMLEVALKFRRVFDRMRDECLLFVDYFREKVKKGERDKFRVGPPIEDDWQDAKSFVHFLGMFYQSTLALSATKTCTSHLLYTTIMALRLELENKASDYTDDILQMVARSMKQKFDKYWKLEEVNQLVFIANVLDPRYKFQMIKVSLKKTGESNAYIQEFVYKVKEALQSLWLEYKGGEGCSESLGSRCQRMQLDPIINGGGVDLFSNLNAAIDEQNEEEQLEEISNEVDKYIADKLESRQNSDFNLLDWLRAEEFSLYKDPTDEELELYHEVEEIETISTALQTQPSGTT